MTDEQETECRDEAERLAALTAEEQHSFLAMLRADAANRKVPKRDQEFARERADILEQEWNKRKRKNA